MNRFFVVLLFCLTNLPLYAQNKSLFKDGDKVCFVGNSITNNGEFYNFVYLYYATRFPFEKVTFLNCGISGDDAAGMLRRLDEDVLSHKPSWTVLMVGMNDVRRNLYIKANEAKSGIDAQKKQAIERYKQDCETLVEKMSKNSHVILQKPTIYDQTVVSNAENAFGVNDALGECAAIMLQLSKKYNTRLVDYRTLMNRINDSLQKNDVSLSVVGKDRIHPESPGHFLMAYQFLKETEAPKYVSKIYLNIKNKKTEEANVNCQVSNIKVRNEGVSFECLENSLPFPVKDEAEKVLQWVPFTKELNQQLLNVKGLKKGIYDLWIDGKKISSYSEKELNEGINLSLKKHTPQYQQAIAVMNLCVEYRKQESFLRSLKFVELLQKPGFAEIKDITKRREMLDERLKDFKNSGHSSYYETQFNKYLLNKPKELDIRQKLDAIKAEIYKINKPVVHTFRVVHTFSLKKREGYGEI